jgi:hypothetical protein
VRNRRGNRGVEIGVRQIELTFMTHAALILISK